MNYNILLSAALSAFFMLGTGDSFAERQVIRQLKGAEKSLQFGAKKPIRLRRSIPARLPASSTNTYFESFEDVQAATAALPAGWQRGESEGMFDFLESFYVYAPTQFDIYYYGMPEPSDGKQYLYITYGYDYKDERVSSPQFRVKEGDILSFDWFYHPLFLYTIDRDHVDFETDSFIDREIAVNIEAYISVDGGEEIKIFDLDEIYGSYEYGELRDLSEEMVSMERFSFPLEEYVGSDVSVSFRYHGTDGDAFMLDRVTVDSQEMAVRYEAPLFRQFFGLTLDGNFDWTQDTSIELYPVETPLTWAYLPQEDTPWPASFAWEYNDLSADGNDTEWYDGGSTSELTVTYRPDYQDLSTLHNNLYYLPKMQVETAGFATSSFSGSSDFLQAGGCAELPDENGEYRRYGILPFSVVNEGFGIYAMPPTDFGDNDIPIFGYSSDTDEWWHNYSFRDPEIDHSEDTVYCDAVMNHIIAPESPMVVYGASVAAIGRIKEGAQFRLEVFEIDDEGYTAATPITTAECSGADVVINERGVATDFLGVNFRFDSPIVLNGEAAPQGYIVMFSGYRDPENVEYFAPCQSLVGNEYGYSFGLYRFAGTYFGTYGENISYPGYFPDADGNDLDISWAISLDAYYPWLNASDDTIELGNTAQNILFRSYYSGADFTIEASEGIDASLDDARYVNTLTVAVAEGKQPAENSTVTVTAPGVQHTFNLHVTGSGIESVEPDTAIGDVINLQGITVRKNATLDDLNTLPRGIYIHSNRKTGKVLKH